MKSTFRTAVVSCVCSLAAAFASGQSPVVHELQRFTAADASSGDYFGLRFGIDGSRLAVAAHGDRTLGVAGSVYVFEEAGGLWTQVAKITPEAHLDGDGFAYEVDFERGVIAIGVPSDEGKVNNSGAVHIYREIQGNWTRVTRLLASDGRSGSNFGLRFRLHESTAIVGARSDATQGAAAGAAYIFREENGVWRQVAKLLASDGRAGEQFGYDVAIDGNTAVVSAAFHDRDGALGGAVYVFREDNGVWSQVAKLTAPSGAAGDRMGSEIDMSGGTIVAGAPYSTTPLEFSGSVHLFRSVAGQWSYESRLLAETGFDRTFFGTTVRIDGDTLLAAGTGTTDLGPFSGFARVFHRTPMGWRETARPLPLVPARGQFGSGCAMQGVRLVIGANTEDSPFLNCGAAYSFETPRPCLADFDGDGRVEPADLAAYVIQFETGGSAADFNGDGFLDFFDYDRFVGLFEAGCTGL